MNEMIFFFHILAVVGGALLALRLGKATLTTFIALQVICANLFVFKQMSLFGLSVTCSDALAVGAILGVNLMQEYFGKDAARRAIWVSFGALFFFLAMSGVHIAYAPILGDVYHDAYATLFNHSTRVCIASVGVYAVVQFFDLRFFGVLQRIFEKKHLPVRIALSLFVSQALDTVLFSFFGLYGIVDSLLDVMMVSFLIKCCIIALSSPLTALSRRLIKETYVPV